MARKEKLPFRIGVNGLPYRMKWLAPILLKPWRQSKVLRLNYVDFVILGVRQMQDSVFLYAQVPDIDWCCGMSQNRHSQHLVEMIRGHVV